jgi:hypothetical protein
MTKSSPSIWHLLSKRQIDGEDFIIFVDFLENMNFTQDAGFDTIILDLFFFFPWAQST